jgi:hypothetical protein
VELNLGTEGIQGVTKNNEEGKGGECLPSNSYLSSKSGLASSKSRLDALRSFSLSS